MKKRSGEMNTREMGYSDYGFDSGEEKLLKQYCRLETFSDYDTLLQSALSANPAIAGDLFYSLLNGLSYDSLIKIKYIPYSKGDFYAYQRRCLSVFRNFLLFYGKWK